MAIRVAPLDDNLDFPEAVQQRQAERFRDSGTAEGASLSATSASVSPFRPVERLDIWDGGDLKRTYTEWIAYLDSKLSGAVTSRAVIGQAVGGRDIIAYTAGQQNAPQVLIVGGLHGHEAGAQAAAGEFFIQFATSQHPAMVALRRRAQVTLVPTANPSGYYSSRENTAGVDLNRDWPFNWNYNASTDRGATPLSQPESRAIKALIESRPIGLVIDCHNSGSSDPEMQISSAVDALMSKRRSVSDAILNWQIANDDAAPVRYFTPDTSINCTLANWATRFTRFDLGRENGQGVIIEGRPGGGNSAPDTLSRTGARYYASAIYHVILSWLNLGQVDDPPQPQTYWGTSSVFAAGSDTVSFDQPNGRLIDSTTYKPAQLQYTVAGNSRNYIGFPIRYPARMFADVQIELEGGSVASRVEARLAWGPIPLDGSNLSANSSTTASIDIPADGRGQLTVRATDVFPTIPEDSAYLMQVFLRVATAPGAGQTGPRVRVSSGIKATMRLDPTFFPFRVPRISRP